MPVATTPTQKDLLIAARWIYNQLLSAAGEGRIVIDREQAQAACENWAQVVREAGYNPRTCEPINR